MAYEFNIIGQEREPTQDEIYQGLIHHVATLLNLCGEGKNSVLKLRELENRKPTKEDVYFFMNRGIHHIEKVKTILINCPTITIRSEGMSDKIDEE